ncbi:MAG: hypothetical protein LBK53_04485 [Heliobacteriaceae bacterium]|jgi:hypothetical protein|nr:hypothetical protein [Heliobacteriaceae bacterium]
MIVRILLILLAVLVAVHLVILSLSQILGTDIYKEHGKTLLKYFAIFVLFVMALFFTFMIYNK